MQIGEPGARRERQAGELGMRIVDDLGSEFDGGLGLLSGARRVPGERHDQADLDALLCRHWIGEPQNERGCHDELLQ
jgi:hypothetical protein